MFCPKCGLPNRQDARFCSACGMRLIQNAPIIQAPQSQPPDSSDPGGQGWRSSVQDQQMQSFTPYAPSGPKPVIATPPYQSQRQKGLEGVARDVQHTTESAGYGGGGQGSIQQTIQILRFRLEQYDGSGNRVRVVPVEMRGISIIGFLNDNDDVEVFGKNIKGLIHANKIQNRSTGAIVAAKSSPLIIKILFAITVVIAIIIFIAVTAFIIYGISSSNLFPLP